MLFRSVKLLRRRPGRRSGQSSALVESTIVLSDAPQSEPQASDPQSRVVVVPQQQGPERRHLAGRYVMLHAWFLKNLTQKTGHTQRTQKRPKTTTGNNHRSFSRSFCGKEDKHSHPNALWHILTPRTPVTLRGGNASDRRKVRFLKIPRFLLVRRQSDFFDFNFFGAFFATP